MLPQFLRSQCNFSGRELFLAELCTHIAPHSYLPDKQTACNIHVYMYSYICAHANIYEYIHMKIYMYIYIYIYEYLCEIRYVSIFVHRIYAHAFATAKFTCFGSHAYIWLKHDHAGQYAWQKPLRFVQHTQVKMDCRHKAAGAFGTGWARVLNALGRPDPGACSDRVSRSVSVISRMLPTIRPLCKVEHKFLIIHNQF